MTDDALSAGSARRLRVSVISPSRVGFEGEASAVVAPAHDGLLGILPGHAPMVVLLGSGSLSVRTAEGTRRFSVARGFLQVVDDAVSVLAEQVETT
ncbi:MAG: F0F1 ATP synthase subunit epsilon [Gemmatimonadota bacterium]